jgi:DNA-binding NtrC family response regulator
MASVLSDGGIFLPLGVSLEEVERAYIIKTLSTCGNNKTLAAKKLGISRKTLYDRLTRWNLKEG